MRRVLVLAALIAAAGPARAATPVGPTLRIIFPEGLSVRQMADQVAHVRRIAIAKRHVTPVLTGTAYAAAAAAARPPAPFATADVRHSIEGFLFPAGYDFGPSTTATQLVALQLRQFEAEWATVTLGPRARRLGPYAVLTIASMVEREAAVPAERKLIAAVIYNRLEAGMPLGVDATLRYGLGIQGTRPLTAAQIASSSPYNTLRLKGLPPTPIANPGLPSLRAAAAPASIDALYYVREPHSLHHFFTAQESVFCSKLLEWGYHPC